MSEPTRWPLAWPVGWRRTPSDRRTWARFRTGSGAITVAAAVTRVSEEMRRWGIRDWAISSNVETRLDGTPYSNRVEPTDVGAAVYFRLRAGGRPKVFACDRWNRVAGNIAAIAGHIEALRRVERYGVGETEQVLAGYTALPPSAEDWRSVFSFGPDATPTLTEVDRRFKGLMKSAHPDRESGDSLQAARLNTARDMARWELGAGGGPA